MRETSSRLLALLALMQSRPAWPGAELAERLGVSTRTIRNDIDRLRELGYPVDAVRGPGGYYQLGVGAKLPPLLLDDEEAVAVAIGLRTGAGVIGIEESSARALAKLEQVLPHRLQRQVSAIGASMSKGPDNTGTNVQDPEVDAAALTAIAAAIRDHHWLRFTYGDPASDDRGHAHARRAVPAGELGALLVPGRPRPRVGLLAYVPGRLDRPADADRSSLHADTARRARTTRASSCATSPRPAGRCTRGSRSSHRPRRCCPGSTPQSGSSSPSTSRRRSW